MGVASRWARVRCPLTSGGGGQGVGLKLVGRAECFCACWRCSLTVVPGPSHLDLRENLFGSFRSLHLHPRPEFGRLGDAVGVGNIL